jgi:hypothetical protein
VPKEKAANNKIEIGRKRKDHVMGLRMINMIKIRGTKDSIRFTNPVPIAEIEKDVFGIYIRLIIMLLVMI